MRAMITSVLLLAGATAHAQPADHHVAHNMVLYGEESVYASHIVYKAPHNYEVILRVNFSPEIKGKYLAARRDYPEDTLILFLGPMLMQNIASEKFITGTLLRANKDGKRFRIQEKVKIERKDYQVIFFNELPLSLAP